jgi:hypothetical protein
MSKRPTQVDLPTFLTQREEMWWNEEREPPTREEQKRRLLALVFDCGQLARRDAMAANAKSDRPKQRRLADVPRTARVAFARWKDASQPGHPTFDLYRVMVDGIEQLTGSRDEAERLCEEAFAKGWRKRYRSATGKVQDATVEERAIHRLVRVGTAEGDGRSMEYSSRVKRAARAKAMLGVKVKLRYEKPAGSKAKPEPAKAKREQRKAKQRMELEQLKAKLVRDSRASLSSTERDAD